MRTIENCWNYWSRIHIIRNHDTIIHDTVMQSNCLCFITFLRVESVEDKTKQVVSIDYRIDQGNRISRLRALGMLRGSMTSMILVSY